MLKHISFIECFYVFLPLTYLIIATFGTVSQFIRIATDYRAKLSPYMLMADDINASFQSLQITDLKAVNISDWYCPDGYSVLNISSWPGNKVGCYNKVNGTLYDKDCYSSGVTPANSQDWEPIPSHPKISLPLWGTYKLCAKFNKYPTVNFATSTCPEGYKTCSKRSLCVLDSDVCPISSVDFEWKNNGWNLSLVIGRDPNENAIIDIRTSTNGLPCLNPSKLPLSDRVPTYPLEAVLPDGCDRFGTDVDFAKGIDQEPLLQFYSENSLDGIYNNLPNYVNYLGESSIVLYSKTLVDINPIAECNNIGTLMTNISNTIKEFTFSNSIMTTLIAYNVIILVFGFVVFLYLYLDKESEEREKYFREQKCLLHSFHFIPYIICIIFIAQYSQIPDDGGPMTISIRDMTNLIIDNQCFNHNQYSDVFAELQDDLNNLSNYFFGVTELMGLVSYVFIVLMLIVRGLRGYYIKEVQEFENNYLESRFVATRTQPETELTGVDIPSNTNSDLPPNYEYGPDEGEIRSPYHQYGEESEEV